MNQSNNASVGHALTSAKTIGMIPDQHKVGDVVTLVFQGYGGIQPYVEGQMLNPMDRLIELEIKNIKKIKVEYIEA